MKRLVGVVLAVLVVAPAAAQAPGLALTATKKPVGRIGLTLQGPPGALLTVTERARVLGQVTLDDAGQAALPRAATWQCKTRIRRFVAAGTGPDGTPLRADARVQTPSCEKRFALEVKPKQPRAGDTVRVTLTDRFKLGGLPGRACVGEQCQRLTPGANTTRLKLRVGQAGRDEVRVRVGGREIVRPIAIQRPKHINLLATGDSMIQLIDGYMKARLAPRNVSVKSDARISTGLSKPDFFNWPEHAVKQATKGADVTVMFIGANDGFPYGSVQCCGPAWTKRYAQIVSRMMATYADDGRDRVYWCLLPAPREGNFRKVFVAVNAAIRSAAARHPDTVRLIDLPAVFTPGYVYRDDIDGRRVRQEDGVHLNLTGASIAADVIIRRMRRDGVL